MWDIATGQDPRLVYNYFTVEEGSRRIIMCIGRNRCATYTNSVITIRNHICKLAACGPRVQPWWLIFWCVIATFQMWQFIAGLGFG